MSTEEEHRKQTLDHYIDERFAEIFFIAKEEYDIKGKSQEEKLLYDLLEKFKYKLKKKCRHHFYLDEEEEEDEV